MDDMMPPNVLANRVRRLEDEADCVETILISRREEWRVAAHLVGEARKLLELACGAATLAAEAYPEHPGRWGGFCLTHKGIRFYPLDPRPREVDPVDIAHALAATCRFSGMVRRFYSVGAHSLRVAGMASVLARKEGIPPDDAYIYGLLHDAAEAYLPDIPRPIKGAIPGWMEIEDRVLRVVWKRFGLDPMPYDIGMVVKQADDFALAMEAHALMPEPDTVWSSFPTPNDPDIAEIGKVKEGDRWWGKEHVEEIFLTSLRARVPQYDFPPPADAEELHEAHDAAQAAIGTSLPPPPVARPSAGWEDELRVNTVDPEEDARVERNKRRLMEEGDGA